MNPYDDLWSPYALFNKDFFEQPTEIFFKYELVQEAKLKCSKLSFSGEWKKKRSLLKNY